MIRTVDTLHRHVESLFVSLLCHIDILQIFENRRAFIPGHVRRLLCDVVALRCGHRNDLHIAEVKFICQHMDLFGDLVEALLAVIGEVHFVDSEYKIVNPHQRADSRVTARLHQNSLCGVNQDDRKIRKGGTDSHVPCILLMSRRVRNDKGTFICGEIAVCHVDGNSLLPLCHQAVQKKGVIDVASRGSDLGVQEKSLLLIRVQKLRVIENMSDQCGFSVINAAACDKFQKIAHQKYPSLLRFSILASPPSLSMTRVVLSDSTEDSVSAIILSSVSASDSNPPVRG